MFRIEEPGPLPSPLMSMGDTPVSPIVRGLAAPPAREVTAHDVSDEVLGGAWVVDLRADRRHEADPMAYVGWLRPVEDGFALLADSREALDDDWFDLTA